MIVMEIKRGAGRKSFGKTLINILMILQAGLNDADGPTMAFLRLCILRGNLYSHNLMVPINTAFNTMNSAWLKQKKTGPGRHDCLSAF